MYLFLAENAEKMTWPEAVAYLGIFAMFASIMWLLLR